MLRGAGFSVLPVMTQYDSLYDLSINERMNEFRSFNIISFRFGIVTSYISNNHIYSSDLVARYLLDSFYQNKLQSVLTMNASSIKTGIIKEEMT